MATTIVKTGNFISITGITADVKYSDISSTADGADNLRISIISFKAGSGADIIAIRDSDVTAGAKMMFEKLTATLAVTKYFDGVSCRPCIKFSECTLTAGHEVTICLM